MGLDSDGEKINTIFRRGIYDDHVDKEVQN